MKRHRARRLALQGLCCLDAQGDRVKDLVDEFLADNAEDESTIRTARQMLEGTRQSLPECDRILAGHTRDWELGRLALVDRNILRLGVWEFLTGQAPFKVVIVEAIKLAREFSTAESPRFINGVLDSVARALHAGTDEARRQSVEAKPSIPPPP